MQITKYPRVIHSRCLVLVGGSGDTAEGFLPLVEQLSQKLPSTNIITFTFSSASKTENILELQSRELFEVLEQISSDNHFKSIDIFETSKGAYATIKLLSSNKYSNLINKVILFDPADYYMSAKFGESKDSTWSGSAIYNPTSPVVSDLLSEVSGRVKISVIHLTLHNYGPSDYLENTYHKRGEDNPIGYPRLSTEMVKNMYKKIPKNNKGEYLELNDVPHAILRDGDISKNISNTVIATARLLV